MNKNFVLWKKQALSKLDKSNIGSIDKHILNLCNKINQRDDMFTLSSCSGRSSIQIETNGKKIENIWEFVSHEKLSFDEINNFFKNYDKKNKLKFLSEATIMHICVETFGVAQKLIQIAKESGFNRAGIIALKTKIVVEIICDARIECPIFNEKLLFDDNYLNILVEKSNLVIQRSWDSIDLLDKNLDEL